MKAVVAVIAAGAMGSAVGKRLTENGVDVVTSLAGRSEASAARAREAGMRGVSEEEIAAADFVLSIVPPGDALALAERLAPHLERANRKAVYVDCNAVNPQTVARIAPVIEATGAPFVDAGIVGPPPKPGNRTIFYASGTEAPRFATLNDYGLEVRVLGAALGDASALKMSYAGITKGFTAISTAMMLAATRNGTAEALQKELAESQPQLTAWLTRQVPNMYAKAYRWVAEMEEIAGFVGEDAAAHEMFEGTARLYERIAADEAGEKKETAALTAFLAKRS
jgi:3-hydroxyisobutyrate dehydrogenase-like beta-hydroxyacid dehydrogenase